jgi:LysW-gamma-L-lysine carboxypeptidase
VDRDRIFLEELVRCASPSGAEQEIGALLVSRLPALGWERVELDDVGNVVASRGKGPREVLLLGHVDTVPGGPPVRWEGEVLWGRGAVDAKGAFGAFALAGGACAVPEGGRITLVGAVGEERDSRGARYRLMRHAPEACLVGEPSGSDGVTLGYRGRIFCTLEARDGGAHRSGDAGPHTACLRGAAAVLDSWERGDDPTRPVIERPSGAVAFMEGREEGERWGRVELDLRLPLGAEPEGVAREVREVAERWGVTVSFPEKVGAHMVPRDDLAVRALRGAIRQVFGRAPRLLAKGGTADFNLAASWGCPLAAYGPGDSRLDHTAEERLPLEEFRAAVAVLQEALPRLWREEA